MITTQRARTLTVVSSTPRQLNGATLTPSDLPPSNTVRWTIARKVNVVRAIDAGMITEDDAATRYKLSAEELAGWKEAIEKTGPQALRVTHLHEYRHTGESVPA